MTPMRRQTGSIEKYPKWRVGVKASGCFTPPIPNFLLPQTSQKFILFGGKGEVSVWWKILFEMRPVFLLSAFVTPLRLPEGCKSSESENLHFGHIVKYLS